jgi:hypothetical protein
VLALFPRGVALVDVNVNHVGFPGIGMVPVDVLTDSEPVTDPCRQWVDGCQPIALLDAARWDELDELRRISVAGLRACTPRLLQDAAACSPNLCGVSEVCPQISIRAVCSLSLALLPVVDER